MDIDLNELKEDISRYSDDDLIAMTSINANYYRKEMIDPAKDELEKRGIAPIEDRIQFDLLVNSENYAGRLIMIGEELLFLSTGLSKMIVGSSGLIGLISKESQNAVRTVAAKRLNFAAINNPGSWAYFLDQISYCEYHSSWAAGGNLQISGTDENGSVMNRSVDPGTSPPDDFRAAERKIKDAVSGYK